MGMTRDQILERNDLKTTTVDVPEWGDSLIIREWTVPERGAFMEAMEKRNANGGAMGDVMALAVALSVVDENGNRMFSDKDVDLIRKKSGRAAERIFTAAISLNSLSSQDIEALRGN